MEKIDRLMKLAAEAMRELDVIGVPYVKPIEWKLSKATSTWGVCNRRKNVVTGKYDYTIRISLVNLDDKVSDENVKDTIIHELIHTIPGCFDHQSKFKEYAALVNDCYACYHISRTSSAADICISKSVVDEYRIRKSTTSYVVGCYDCGARFKYKNKTKLITILSKHSDLPAQTTHVLVVDIHSYYFDWGEYR